MKSKPSKKKAGLKKGHRRLSQVKAFLTAFKVWGTVETAAKKCGIDPSRHYRWMKRHEVYRGAFAAAEIAVGDMIEREVMHRALKGVKESVYYHGRVVGHVFKPSDLLLIFLSKARIARYRGLDRIDMRADVSGKIEHEHVLQLDLSPDRLQQIATILREARVIDVQSVPALVHLPQKGDDEKPRPVGGNGKGSVH